MVSDLGPEPLSSTMSEDVTNLERNQHVADLCVKCEPERQFKFDMVQRGDFIKPGCWHWRCRREDGAGDVVYGYVQADPLGLVVVPETFEKDRL